ncbi:MAG: HAD-IC family P-type ATPase [Deltaproteobacteria bacterium]|nr:HAD-IC family P-type ATPase [Deltaproteobacteria bacterium]
MDELLENHWHHLPIAEVRQILEVHADGLRDLEVRHRLERFGPNQVTAVRQRSAMLRLLAQFNNPLIYILLASAVVTALLKGPVDAIAIALVVVVNALLGFVQESRAEAEIESLRRMVTTEATVIREGERKRVPSAELVPGDLVALQSGDRVPADLRLAEVRELHVDESALTGESVPVPKDLGPLAVDAPLAERFDMAYAGSVVTYGQARGLVVATGDGTETGRIAKLVGSASPLETPLTRKIAHFSKVLLVGIVALAATAFIVGVLRRESWAEMLIAAVTLAVAAIPEGLPAVVTITLAIGVRRMARRRAIIRKLPAVETLGSTTVVCSDKTGTLTRNEMTVVRVQAGGETFELEGSGYEPSGEVRRAGQPLRPGEGSALEECLRAGILCNDTQLERIGERWQVQGDPTEAALRVSAAKLGLARPEALARFHRLDEIPFESDRQYMATLHTDGDVRRVDLKGSVERVLARCTHALGASGQALELNAQAVLAQAEALASRGLRVLAFAKKVLEADRAHLTHEDVAADMVFLGLQAMLDPPRPEAIAAVRACRSAGVRVKMITGDHPLTAAAIARELGLEGSGQAITGRELERLHERELIDVADRCSVFARVAPEQKLELVEALQSRGHVVAMTGDGVNDAPALRKADIGVAMGITGTDAAKEAAAMVLTDDDFATIEAAIEEGRGVFDNLTKFIVWTLPTNIGQGMVILAAVVLGLLLPILPVQVLWINMTTAVFLGLALAFEPKEAGIMARPPRARDTPILTAELVTRTLFISALLLVAAFGVFEWEQSVGEDLASARTAAVNVFVLVQGFYLFNCRSLTRSVFSVGLFSNLWAVGGLITMIAAQVAFTYLPILNHLFKSDPVRPLAWLWALLASLLGVLFVGLEKWVRGRIRKRRPRRPLRKSRVQHA